MTARLEVRRYRVSAEYADFIGRWHTSAVEKVTGRIGPDDAIQIALARIEECNANVRRIGASRFGKPTHWDRLVCERVPLQTEVQP